MSTLACQNCGSRDIEQQDASGATVCMKCGVVLEEDAIVSAVEFVENAGGASSMVGQWVSGTSSKAYTGGNRGGYGFSRDSRETTLANGRRKIQEVASRLRLRGNFVDAAHRLFTIAVEKNFVQGRRTIHVVAACLYIACRQEQTQHMLIDFSDALQVNVYTLGTCFLKFRRLLGLELKILDPALYVYRFAAHLDLSDKASVVSMTALRLVGCMKRDWIVAGRRPAGICAAALLIAARAHGFSRHPQDVTRILRVCGLTVSTRVKEFEQTRSANLTLKELETVELKSEADPPIFTRNRMLEARARAIQENDVDLLNSGALDDPMGGKSASKWREGKANQKEKDFEKLYQSLEEEMVNQLKDISNKEKSIAANGDKGVDGGDIEGTAKKQLDGTGSDEPAEGDDNNSVGKGSKEKVVSILKTPADKDSSTPLELSKNVTIATENNELVHIPSQWRSAYPKSKYGKALILPDQSTPEERQPSVTPDEGILDVKVWKESMPQDMVEDMESIFRTPTEIAQKEAIFNKINKDYIILQAQKEKNRKNAEETKNEEDKDMAEQVQGHERYRKRKNRGKESAETTEEALLQAVASRKISRKINYDAMSAIFDDDGTFSTGEAATSFEEVPMEAL